MAQREDTSTSPPRVGRPPVAAERREQIFDAVEECLVELGLAGTTLEAIAERAGMTRSAIAYFVGNRDQVIDAAVARSVGRFVATMKEAVEAARPEERLEAYVEYVLASHSERARWITVMDEVVAYAHHDERARGLLRRGYEGLQEYVEQLAAYRFPDAAPAQRNTVVTAINLLLREYDRVRSLGVGVSPLKQRRQVREAAYLLIASLEE